VEDKAPDVGHSLTGAEGKAAIALLGQRVSLLVLKVVLLVQRINCYCGA
jgi:hypothetical protein